MPAYACRHCNAAVRPQDDGVCDDCASKILARYSADDRFDMACGLYWYCAWTHGGQGSPEYRMLSTLGYKPGAAERGPEEGSVADEVYDHLCEGDLSIDDVYVWIETNRIREG
jgi:hypothetical protein